MNYQYRICCFIDILGFKEHLDATIDPNGNDVVEKINSIKSILDLSKDITNDNGHSKTRVVTYFSDSIVISYEYNEESQLFWNLLNLLHVSTELAINGFLTRGGVAIGKLIHNSEIIFGPALVKAYNIESKISKYPRIIVDKKVIEEGLNFHSISNTKEEEEEHVMNIVTLDDDDNYYIDYIQKSSSEFDDVEYDLFTFINRLKDYYFSNYENQSDDVRVKLDWLKQKINNLISNIKRNIQNPRYAPDLIELYSQVDYIQ